MCIRDRGYLLLNLRQEGFRDAVRDTDSEVLLTDRYDNLIYTTLDPREDPQDKQPSNKFSLSRDVYKRQHISVPYEG